MPVLDDPFNPVEVDQVIQHQIKANKGSGPDGVCPGLLKLLPVQWIIFLCTLFNKIFYSCYPERWYVARLHVLFKKGQRNLCSNYRGISIMDTMAKLYDYLLYNRLRQWYKPDREQAGAQEKRGCLEHIVTLRLIIT